MSETEHWGWGRESTLWGRGGKREDKHWKSFLAPQTLLSHPTFHLEGILPLFDYMMKQTVKGKIRPTERSQQTHMKQKQDSENGPPRGVWCHSRFSEGTY